MSRVWRNRVLASAIVASCWAASFLIWPVASIREQWIYACITTLGYGHLLGAAWFAPRRSPAGPNSRAPQLLKASFIATSIGTGFCLYALLLERTLIIALPLVLLSLWHAVENEIALGSNATGGVRLPPIPLALRDHAWLIASAPLVLLLLGSTVEIAEYTGSQLLPQPLHLVDLYGVPVLYHLVSWLIWSFERARDERLARGMREARGRYGGLIGVHVAPMLLCSLVLCGAPYSDYLARVFYGPDVYLYLSGLHVVQTGLARQQRSTRGHEHRATTQPLGST